MTLRMLFFFVTKKTPIGYVYKIIAEGVFFSYTISPYVMPYAELYYSAEIAPTGHADSQAPHERQVSLSISYCESP